MNYTENLTLGLPEYGEDADVADLNRNSGILDAYCYNTRQIECEPYDSTKTYMSGDLSIHNEVVYECNTDNTTGAWDDSKWDSTTLAEQIAKAKQSGGGAEVTKEASGNPIELTDAASAPLVKCTTAITGSQDLHGYDKPWVGGAGKNKLPLVLADIKSINSTGTWSGLSYIVNGVTFTVITDNDGNVTGIKANGTATAIASLYIINSSTVIFQINEYKLNGITNGGSSTYSFVYLTANYNWKELYDGETVLDLNTSRVRIDIKEGYIATNLMFYPMVRLSTVTDPTFSPYSNICPITAYTEGEVEVSDGDGNVTTHTATFSQSIYQGNADFVGGTATMEWIKVVFDGSSDEGWTIATADTTAFFFCSRADVPTPNWSDILCDSFKTVKTASERVIEGTIWIVYQQIHIHATRAIAPSGVTSEGLEEFKTWLSNNPIEVAYPVKTPTTSSITPTNLPIKSLFGYNHIESSTGDMEIEYITEGYQPLVDIIQSSNGHTYSTQEQVVGKWIDGSDLYECTFELSNPSGSGVISTGQTYDIAFLVSGYYVLNDGNSILSANQFLATSNFTYVHVEKDGDIQYRVNGYTATKLSVTIRYTKPTQTRSLNTPVTSQKAQIEPLTDKTEEVPTEEEKAVNEEENNDETR